MTCDPADHAENQLQDGEDRRSEYGDIWNIAAFVKQLPAMTPEEYAAAGEGQSSSGDAVNPPPQGQQPQVQQ